MSDLYIYIENETYTLTWHCKKESPYVIKKTVVTDIMFKNHFTFMYSFLFSFA
jgi:hypothetical protein